MAAVVDVDAFEDKVEGGEEEDEPTNSSPQANSDRDYTMVIRIGELFLWTPLDRYCFRSSYVHLTM